MKNTTLLFIVFILWAFSASYGQSGANPNLAKPLIQVYYFHATGRCPTCLAVEANSQKIVEEKFKKEVENDLISFQVFNFDEDSNKALVEKYQIMFSTLLLVVNKGGQEKVIDLTDDGFKYALTEPQKFENLLISEIRKNLE